MKQILGIDASTKKTGYGIIDDSGKLIDSGVVYSNNENIRMRMEEIYFSLKDIIENKDIKVIIIEDVPLSNHNNLKTGKDLSTLQGVILGLCFELRLPCIFYNPSAWRSINDMYTGTRDGIKRENQKQAAVDKVNELYNLNFKYFKNENKVNHTDDDRAEAILIARAYYLESKEV